MTTRPKLADLKKICPQDLAHCEGYVWHLGSRIGKGSFGEVYLGWNTAGTEEVAVKVVRKEFFKQDPKVRENLDREIRILKLLRGCEYVVHLHHVQELKQFIVLVMELCEYDLDHLVKVQPFKEDDITLFLYQLSLGMKALRNQNIVHRDLKPGNILIMRHPHTGKMMIKLADFGFARHFKDEGHKPIDMTSLAGTPVFMAPEALRCVFHPGEHYDDKVDIWSIGALLYKVIMGVCGFYAQLQDIPRILKHKGDAIAFERVPHSRKVNYVMELPSDINNRLSEPFRQKMNSLLRALLKLDPTERMTFPELFEFVDDLITSKVEMINLLHGTSFKVIFDPHMTPEQLTMEITGQSGIPPDGQVVFSGNSPHSLSVHTHLTQQQFSEFLERAGGTRGHAILHLLPIPQLQSEKLLPDYSCLAQLTYAVDDPANCASLIVEHKYADEIVHAMSYLQVQQKRQLTGMEEFCNFCSRQLEQFTTEHHYNDLYQRGLQVLAKAGLAMEWLNADIANLAATSLPAGVQTQLKTQVAEVTERRTEIERLVNKLSQRYRSCTDALSKGCDCDLKEEELARVTATFAEEAKKLPKLRKDIIHRSCKQLLDDCKQQVVEITERVHTVLRGAFASLAGIWEMQFVAQELQEKCSSYEQYLVTQVPQYRGTVFKSLSAGTLVTGTQRQSPGVVATTPEGQSRTVTPWAGVPVPLSNPSYYTHPPPPSASSFGPTQVEIESLRTEREKFQRLFESKSKQCNDLLVKMNELKGQLSDRTRNSSTSEEEATIRPGTLRPPSPSGMESGSFSSADSKVMETLTEQLRVFCLTADKLKPGLLASVKSSPPTSTKGSHQGALYPTIPAVNMDEYSFINMPDQKAASNKPAIEPPQSIQLLLPYAKELMSILQGSMPELEAMLKGHAPSPTSSTLIKITKPNEYGAGDMVLFHPIRLQRSRSSAPMLLHLQKPRPFILMDIGSYAAFGIRPGRMPDIFLAKLKETPKRYLFEEDEEMARELGEKTGEFFRVRAEPGPVKFMSKSPSRPPPPEHHSPGPRPSGHGLRQVFGKVKDFV